MDVNLLLSKTRYVLPACFFFFSVGNVVKSVHELSRVRLFVHVELAELS